MMEIITWLVQSYIQRNIGLIIVILAVLLVRLFMKKMPTTNAKNVITGNVTME